MTELEIINSQLVLPTQDHGCEGGLMDFAFDFIIENGGIDTEDDYPYLAADGACAKKKLHRHMVSIDGYEDVPANDEDALLKVRLEPSNPAQWSSRYVAGKMLVRDAAQCGECPVSGQ